MDRKAWISSDISRYLSWRRCLWISILEQIFVDICGYLWMSVDIFRYLTGQIMIQTDPQVDSPVRLRFSKPALA
ncbi:hypothetical protein K440DRAFT_215416 [Wilcoxina mikolae CBS 423.85]|nr:hypothetical protein K440DRAFT_215416 [Wilcoxina mikolae CBS 423.85]